MFTNPGIDVPVHHHRVAPCIVVRVEEAEPEAEEWATRRCGAKRTGTVQEGAAGAALREEREAFIREVAHEHREAVVIPQIRSVDSHSRSRPAVLAVCQAVADAV